MNRERRHMRHAISLRRRYHTRYINIAYLDIVVSVRDSSFRISKRQTKYKRVTEFLKFDKASLKGNCLVGLVI